MSIMTTDDPELPGEPISLYSHAQLALDDARTGWIVHSGNVTIFFTEVNTGEQFGPRTPLFSCHAGEVLFGHRESTAQQACHFVAVADDDAMLAPVNLEERAEQEDSLLRTSYAKWVDKLTTALAERLGKRESVCLRAGEGELVRLAAGQSVQPRSNRIGWVRIEEGTVRLFQTELFEAAPPTLAIPVAGDTLLQAQTPCRLSLDAIDSELRLPELLDGLKRLHEVCFRCLERQIEQQWDETRRRLSTRREQELHGSVRALRGLAATISPHQTKSDVQYDTDLSKVLGVIGTRIGVTFRGPANSLQGLRVHDQLEAIARSSHVNLREVILQGRWWRSDCGPLLGFIGEAEQPVALLRGTFGYWIHDGQNGKRRRLSRVRRELSPRAVMFYQPFPAGKLHVLDPLRQSLATHYRKFLLLLLCMFLATLLAMIVPYVTKQVFDSALPDANRRQLWELGMCLAAVTCGQAAFLVAETILTLNFRGTVMSQMQSATWDRLLRLPVRFFRKYSCGNLLSRADRTSQFIFDITDLGQAALIAAITAALNLCLLFYYSAQLAWVSLALTLLTAIVTIALNRWMLKLLLVRPSGAAIRAFVTQAVEGIPKIRTAGAELRVFNSWARQYAKRMQFENGMQLITDIAATFHSTLAILGAIAVFSSATALLGQGNQTDGMSIGSFLAFYAVFGVYLGAVVSISRSALDFRAAWSGSFRIKPIMETATETDDDCGDPGRLHGRIELSDIEFRYRNDGPHVLNGVTIQAAPGDFIALTGLSGSGKSTILKLLLGFEPPPGGTILYDGQDLSKLDLVAVRRQIGVLLHSTRLRAGTIAEIIADGNRLSLDEIWVALQDVGLERDVKAMPLGIHTPVTDGGSNLSGGQRQRIMVAQALALNPRILFLDEATSSLDNETQGTVNESVARRNVTRVVVAHRLANVRNADRIYVLSKGRIVQSGNFDELASAEGLFKSMLLRQDA